MANESLHSWGTKGDNSISKDLGVVKKKKTKEGQSDDDAFEEVLPADMLDANTQYKEALQDLEKKQVEKEVCVVYICHDPRQSTLTLVCFYAATKKA